MLPQKSRAEDCSYRKSDIGIAGTGMKTLIPRMNGEQIFWIGCILFWTGVTRVLVALGSGTVDNGIPDTLSSSSLKASQVLILASSIIATIVLYLAKRRMEIISIFIVGSVFWSIYVFFEVRNGLHCHLAYEHGVVCGQIHRLSRSLVWGLIIFNCLLFISLLWRKTVPAKLSLGVFLAFVQNVILLWEYLNI
jgi:hypothetical protein